ncbi:MerR family transcriptional regulator [Paenibacillus polygoni]|uniref:MerR family transcriptional regulator n=1 Tax=Paenibacillus polygoni TaxID=3050112 RepID=A0ABY8X4G7_9BACL|nr:MerR family transcriptional regulator [Paenibacillus polygoni]WIV20059.1 MerR family transcriptional regulator [Paenibacillus polygoni]
MWIINDAQARRNQDKQIALRAVSMLENTDKSKGEQNESLLPERFTIKEIAQNTGIPASAIRYWNQIELLEVERNQTNGYRLFNAEALKQIVLIKTLRNSGYNIPTIKKLLCEVREQNVSLAIQIAKSALEEMNNTLRKQLIGMHYLYKLLRELDHIR